MGKERRILIWTITAVMLLLFSEIWIKNEATSHVVNIIGSLVMMRVFMKAFKNEGKKVPFWLTIAVVAFMVDILLNLIMLSI